VGAAIGAVGAWVGARNWGLRFRKFLERINESIESSHYSELDKFYNDILRLGIDRPYLRSPSPIEDDQAALVSDYDPYPDYNASDKTNRTMEYECYAYMVWNFLETIHDRCVDARRDSLKETWTPVIETENQIHRGWFLSQIRNDVKKAKPQKGEFQIGKFCQAFRFSCWNTSGERKRGDSNAGLTKKNSNRSLISR
jgi:hypothetical protein